MSVGARCLLTSHAHSCHCFNGIKLVGISINLCILFRTESKSGAKHLDCVLVAGALNYGHRTALDSKHVKQQPTI